MICMLEFVPYCLNVTALDIKYHSKCGLFLKKDTQTLFTTNILNIKV